MGGEEPRKKDARLEKGKEKERRNAEAQSIAINNNEMRMIFTNELVCYSLGNE